jgi:hypothetical protein
VPNDVAGLVGSEEQGSQDPTYRLIRSEKVWDQGAALTSRLQTFEPEILAEKENFAGLGRLNRTLIGKAEAMESGRRTVLDFARRVTTLPCGTKDGSRRKECNL